MLTDIKVILEELKYVVILRMIVVVEVVTWHHAQLSYN